jgi:DNA-binding XRE family transcriptional regulator
MTHEERIQNLVRLVTDRLPGVSIAVDRPSHLSGDWLIDVLHRGHSFVIEYRPSLGFGLSSVPSDAYGQGPDEFLEEEASLIDRLVQLVGSGQNTEPQRVRLLQDLRSRREITQNEIADRLGIKQPTVSKIERRADVNLSTLRRYVEALGGTLQVTARFADGTVEVKLGETTPARAR